MESFNEYHSLGKHQKTDITLGFLVPIKESNNMKLLLKQSNKQIIHYDWFKDEVSKISEQLGNTKLEPKEYQVIPRFRYLGKEKTLYVPSNFDFNSMTITHIITEMGLIDIFNEIEVVETKAEDINNKFNLTKIIIK